MDGGDRINWELESDQSADIVETKESDVFGSERYADEEDYEDCRVDDVGAAEKIGAAPEDLEDYNDCSKDIEKKYLPKSDGHWEGEKGDSKWIPDDGKVPGKTNPDRKTWNEIKNEYGVDGIEFVDGEPNFTEMVRGEAYVNDFSDIRYKNFSQADEYEAIRRGCNPKDVKEWRKQYGYTWHERRDCRTMDKVPSIIHNNVFHTGGISEKKKEISMEDWLL